MGRGGPQCSRGHACPPHPFCPPHPTFPPHPPGVLLDVRFPPVVFKKLLGGAPNFQVGAGREGEGSWGGGGGGGGGPPPPGGGGGPGKESGSPTLADAGRLARAAEASLGVTAARPAARPLAPPRRGPAGPEGRVSGAGARAAAAAGLRGRRGGGVLPQVGGRCVQQIRDPCRARGRAALVGCWACRKWRGQGSAELRLRPPSCALASNPAHRSFAVDLDFYGERRTQELKPGGAGIPVTNANREVGEGAGGLWRGGGLAGCGLAGCTRRAHVWPCAAAPAALARPAPSPRSPCSACAAPARSPTRAATPGSPPECGPPRH